VSAGQLSPEQKLVLADLDRVGDQHLGDGPAMYEAPWNAAIETQPGAFERW